MGAAVENVSELEEVELVGWSDENGLTEQATSCVPLADGVQGGCHGADSPEGGWLLAEAFLKEFDGAGKVP